MYIDYTFKVNSFSKERGVISVTYLPVDLSLNLKPQHITGLGIDKQVMVDYSTGVLPVEGFKAYMRKFIIDADSQAQYAWNEVLDARGLVVPDEVAGMLGIEWPTVKEAESSNIVQEEL